MTSKMIFANVMHRPVRTVVSILAVAIEVALVLLVVGLTTGMLNESVKRQEGVGADIMIQPPGASFFLGITAAPMPVKIADRLKEIPHVQAVTPVLTQFNTSGGLNLIYGIDEKSFDAVSGGFVYLSGGPLKNTWDILIDNWYARSNHVRVGGSLHVLGHVFHVVGVVEHGKGARLFIFLKTAQQMTGEANRATLFYVKCTDSGYTSETVAAIQKLLPTYKVLSVREYASLMTSNTIPELTDFVTAMIGIAVGIGFLVIFLSMYTTITERTREIGILKSLGASKLYVVQLILQEAALLGVFGIIVGYIGTGAIRGFVDAYLPTLTLQPVTMDWAAKAAGLAIAASLLGAFYPALRAANLDPIDALGYE
ncbi:MAG: ABC transporter permease [Terriglobia bacterium]